LALGVEGFEAARHRFAVMFVGLKGGEGRTREDISNFTSTLRLTPRSGRRSWKAQGITEKYANTPSVTETAFPFI